MQKKASLPLPLSASFITLLLSSVPLPQKFCRSLYFPSAVSGFCFVTPSLYLCPPLPPVSLLSYFLPFFSVSRSLKSLFLLFLPGFGALSAKWKRVSVQALCFSDLMLQANQWGSWACVNHSHSPHLLFDSQATETHTHTHTGKHIHTLTLDSCLASVRFFPGF